jgi:hypothetical protein
MDTPRSRKPRLYPPSLLRASPYRGKASTLDKIVYWLSLRLPRLSSHSSHAQRQSADYNHAQNRQTSDMSLQKSVWGVGFAESESSVDCGKDTVAKYREALVISFWPGLEYAGR